MSLCNYGNQAKHPSSLPAPPPLQVIDSLSMNIRSPLQTKTTPPEPALDPPLLNQWVFLFSFFFFFTQWR